MSTPDTEWEKEFEAEFMEYAAENENTLIDSDTDGKRVKQFIRSLLTKERDARDTYWKERVEKIYLEILRRARKTDYADTTEYDECAKLLKPLLDNLK